MESEKWNAISWAKEVRDGQSWPWAQSVGDTLMGQTFSKENP